MFLMRFWNLGYCLGTIQRQITIFIPF